MSYQQGAGKLNQRIMLQRHIVNVDAIGNHINTWEDYFSCWASVATSKLNVSEKNEAAQTLEQDRLDFIVRYCPQTSEVSSTEYRIIFKERIYNIDHTDIMKSKKQSLKFSGYLVRR